MSQEFKVLATVQAGVNGSDGMMDRSLAAQWSQVEDAKNKEEKQRQMLLREKAMEMNLLADGVQDRRDQLADAAVAKKRILNEMRLVRSKQEEKVMSARFKGNYQTGVAKRAFARAGQTAVIARTELERCQTRAQDVEINFIGAAAREAEMMTLMKEDARARAAAIMEDSAGRVQVTAGLVAGVAENHEQVVQIHNDHCRTEEFHSRRSAQLKMQCASVGQQDAAVKVRAAVAKSKKEHLVCIGDIKKSREVAATRVTQAHQDLAERRMESQAALERERVCSAQARKIALTLKEQQEADRNSEASRLKSKLSFSNGQAQEKVSNFQIETELAALRNETWNKRAEDVKVTAAAQADEEEEEIVKRLNSAKVSMSRLTAQCAVYIRKLLEQWEEAKIAEAAKVEEATAKMEELTRFCEETITASEHYCAGALRSTEKHNTAKKYQLEEKVCVMDDLAKQRVAMMLTQSQERREKAEAKLARFWAHVEDVQSKCDERVRAEAETAEEKVDMARERFNAEVALAEQRSVEAEARRDVARAGHAAVMARVIGSAMEARRRGLNNIADVIEPEPPKGYPGFDALADTIIQPMQEILEARPEAVTATSVEIEQQEQSDPPQLVPTDVKDGLMATGITAASTTEDGLMATGITEDLSETLQGGEEG